MTLRQINVENLKSQELRAIFEMSRMILQTVDSAAALKEIARITRPVFIFDNVVLYQPREDDSLEPIYAQSVGRGRSAEADMAWGGAIAQEVLKTSETIIRIENVNLDHENLNPSRLDNRHFLGIPLVVEGTVNSALIFIRFGGPEYLPNQVMFGQLIAEHIEHLLERQLLVNRIASLEAQRKLDKLQEEFVASVSHDLRSPLGFIKGYATTLLRNDAEWDNDNRREFLTIIDEETDRLSILIDNLFDSSRLQSGTLPMNYQPIKIGNYLSEFTQRILMGDISVDISLELDPADEIVWMDPTRIIQVLDNIISNAAKYAPQSPVKLSLQFEKENMHLRIQNSGPAIPEGELISIFKRFYRLPEHRERVKGSGLGLYICKQIINAHHGEIYAESGHDLGTCFHILLPRGWVPENVQSKEELKNG